MKNIISDNFLNFERGKSIQVEEAQRVQIKMNSKRPTLRQIIIKMPSFENKERILKAAKETQEVTYKVTMIRPAADFSTGTLHSRREWQETFQGMKCKGLQPRLLYPARLSIKIEGKIRSFPDKTRQKNTPPPNQHCKIC